MEPTAMLISPDEIDVEYVPHPRAGVEEVIIDGEMLLVGGGYPLLLNPTGALVWQCLDGEVSLTELIDDLVDGLGADPDQVRNDVLQFVRSLGTSGLLDGVGIGFDPSDFVPFEQTSPVDVGEELEPFTLTDLDGIERSLSEWRGRQVLVVNWSPGCGYCTKIAPSLGELAPHLADKGIELLFVSGGDADTNRAILSDAGLDAPMLLKGDAPDPFAGFGTPLAYLLDEDGRVATGVGWGADQVLALAQEITGATLLDNPFAPAVPVAEPGVRPDDESDDFEISAFRYLPSPGGMCGPGAGGAGPKTDWVGTAALEFGDWHIGIRHNGDHALDVLNAVFPGARVTDRRVPDNYSVALYERTGKAARELHLLVKGSQQLVRSRSQQRVLRGLLAYLSADLYESDPDLATVHMAAIVRDGQALFVPNDVTYQREQAQPRLAKIGYQMLDQPRVLLDMEKNELVVPEPQVDYDRDVLAALDETATLGSELPAVEPGRYPVMGWVLHATDVSAGPITTARAVASLLPIIRLEGAPLNTAIDEVVALIRGSGVVGIEYRTTRDLVKEVAELRAS
jgi:thiol-disulfide isomerase/thioredoxin